MTSNAPPPTALRRLTRLQTGTIPPVKYKGLSTTPSIASLVPSNYRSALAHPNWQAAMADEFQALVDNGTWRLVPRPPGVNVVTGRWLWKVKYNVDGTLSRHKARWVAPGYNHKPGVDYDETFSPVVKQGTIQTVLSIAASRQWPIH
jgi:histone deacetylase 1/2